MSISAILFDLDDTLLDHTGIQRRLAAELRNQEPAFEAVDADTLSARSMKHLDDLHPRVVSGAISSNEARVERYRRLLRDFNGDESRAGGLAEWHAAAYVAAEQLIPGALALVEAARSRGLRLAVVSNNTRTEQQRKLERHGLAPHFDALVVSGDHGIAKPEPRLFQIALESLQVEAGHSVMVGDSWAADVVGARSAGIRVVWFNRFGAMPDDGTTVEQITSFKDTVAALATIIGH